MNQLIDQLLGFVASVHPAARTAIAGVGILLETSVLLGLIVPGDTVVLVASTAIASPWEYVALLLTVIVGALCGESLGFLIGRLIGPWLRRSRLGRWIGERNWQRAEYYLDRRGGVAVFLSRFLPVLHSLVPVTVGMSTFGYRRFLAWTAPACTVWAVAYVTVGSLAAEGYRQLSSQLHWAGYAFVAMVVVFLIAVLLARRAIARREARHWETPGDGDPLTRDD